MTNVVNIYLDHLIQPYMDVMADIHDKNTFLEWVKQVIIEDDIYYIFFGGLPENNTSINDLFGYFITFIKRQLLVFVSEKVQSDTPTVWDLAYYRDEGGILTRLFGPGTNQLPVDVTFYNNVYQHMMTEEMALGILLALTDYHQIQLSFFGNNIYYNDLNGKYSFNGLYYGNSTYVAWILDDEYYFNTPDLIQGIITGSDWTNSDPHGIATELFIVEGNARVPIIF